MNQWELVMWWYIYALPVNGVNPVDAVSVIVGSYALNALLKRNALNARKNS